jgi:hypothetical protein
VELYLSLYEWHCFQLGLKAIAYKRPVLFEMKKINVLKDEILEEIRPNTYIILKKV